MLRSTTGDIKDTDLLIFGAGPAGLSCAVFLAEMGFRVVIAGREAKKNYPVGESLAPAAGKLIQQLGLWEQFTSGQHLVCNGNMSAWGSEQLSYVDFINNPHGHGWHIDRARFEKMLLDRALSLAVIITTFKNVFTVNVKENNNGWTVNFPVEGLSIHSSFLVDATGRNNSLARKLGIARVKVKEQVAVVAFLETEKELENTASLVETTENGWWYSAAIPDRKLVVCYFTSPEQSQNKDLIKFEYLMDLINLAPHTALRISACGTCVPVVPPRFVDASESRLEKMHGNGWAAIGDAACSYDPLTAHGLTMALTSGRDAATAIKKWFAKDTRALQEYENMIRSVFNYASRNCLQLYDSEKRWPESPFWNPKTVVNV